MSNISDADLDHKVRYFLRELPRVEVFDEEMLLTSFELCKYFFRFFEIIRVMVEGGHMAALNNLLPEYDLILS